MTSVEAFLFKPGVLAQTCADAQAAIAPSAMIECFITIPFLKNVCGAYRSYAR